MVRPGIVLLLWLLMAVLVSANGFVGTLVVAPRVGSYIAHVYKSVVAVGLILLVSHWHALLTVGPDWRRAAWWAGIIWLSLTIAFEFLAGHYLFGNSWLTLFADYRIWRGRLWSLVLGATLLGPVVMAPRLNR